MDHPRERKSHRPRKSDSRIGIFQILPTGGAFYWQFKRGGRIVAKSALTYNRLRAARRAIDNLTGAIAADKFRVDILEE